MNMKLPGATSSVFVLRYKFISRDVGFQHHNQIARRKNFDFCGLIFPLLYVSTYIQIIKSNTKYMCATHVLLDKPTENLLLMIFFPNFV